MKVIEVPVFNEDGSIKLTQLLSPTEAQTLLQFALNFIIASGMSVTYAVSKPSEAEPPVNLQ